MNMLSSKIGADGVCTSILKRLESSAADSAATAADAAAADAASGMKTRTASPPSAPSEITASTRLGTRDSSDDMKSGMLIRATSDDGTSSTKSNAGSPPSSLVTTLAAVADCTFMLLAGVLKRLESSATD